MSRHEVLSRLIVPAFRPPVLLASGHLQTVLVPYLTSGRGPAGERVSVCIEGGSLAARLHRAPGTARSCVMVLHGIAGTADEPFVMRTVHLANRRGLDALRVHLRGAGDSNACGPAPLYHAGLTADIHAGLSFLAERYDSVHIVGFSLGGQLALRAVGEWGTEAPAALASATAISPPIDLAECAAFAELPAAAIYRIFIVRALKQRFAAARHAMGTEFATLTLGHVRSIRDYDAAVVAPFFGFRDVDEYYERVNAGAVLDRIAVPTLILHADDDPLVPVRPIERVAARALPNVRVVTTRHGGHVSFLAARPSPGDDTRFWAEHRAIDLAVAASR